MPTGNYSNTVTGITKKRYSLLYASKEDPQLFFPIPRIRAEELVINQANFATRKKQYQERVTTILQYSENQKTCRSQIIANYFGERSTNPCGTCDNCLQTKKQLLTGVDFEEIKVAIIQLLEKQSLSPTAIISVLKNKNEVQLLKVLDFLQAEETIQISNDGMVFLT